MKKWLPQRLDRVTLLAVLSAAMLGGLLTAKFCWFLVPWWALLLTGLFSWYAFKAKSVAIALLVICAAGGLLGFWKGGVAHASLHGYHDLYGQKVLVTGQIADDPKYDDKRRLDFRLQNVTINDQRMPGEVRVKALGTSARRGDLVRTEGVLQEGFGNYQAALYFAPIHLVQKNTSLIETLRRHFFAGVWSVLPDPQASLGLGFLVGLRAGLPKELETHLRALALTHIVVASGYNLTILVRFSRRLFARFSRFQAFASSLGLMSLMMVVIGSSPSMNRAGVVTFLALVTWYYGRAVHPVLLLLLSAALTAWWNPLALWSDLGWWLSFLAFAGVLLLSPLLTKRLYGARQPPLLVQIGIESLSAQLLVEPLIMLVFGQFSTLGLAANILVAPFIPLAMLGTFIAGVSGMWLPMVAGWFAWPAQLILTYIIAMVQWLAGFSWSSLQVDFHVTALVGSYLAVAFLFILMWRITGHRFREMPSVIE